LFFYFLGSHLISINLYLDALQSWQTSTLEYFYSEQFLFITFLKYFITIHVPIYLRLYYEKIIFGITASSSFNTYNSLSDLLDGDLGISVAGAREQSEHHQHNSEH
jgi:hypothetical protein